MDISLVLDASWKVAYLITEFDHFAATARLQFLVLLVGKSRQSWFTCRSEAEIAIGGKTGYFQCHYERLCNIHELRFRPEVLPGKRAIAASGSVFDVDIRILIGLLELMRCHLFEK